MMPHTNRAMDWYDRDEFLLHFGNEKVNPSWVQKDWLKSTHAYCNFAFRKHWIENKSSSKSSRFFFKAEAYCTFSTCNVLAFLDIKDEGLLNTTVTINIKFEGAYATSPANDMLFSTDKYTSI